MNQSTLMYSGKAKSIFSTDDNSTLLMEFRDDTSAFDGRKTEALSRKGMVNNHFNAFIMQMLDDGGVKTHFIEMIDDTKSLVRHLDMIPIECVVRNIATGSICRRLGVQDGLELETPTFEFFLKNDELHDPMINEYHIRSFNWATDEEIQVMTELTFATNSVLVPLFREANIILVDFKLEFGRYQNELLLGDEFTPDGCRLWDADTREKLDKDRYRQDLGNVVESYEIAARRLGISTI
ncbi:MAG: phosphoribosylaminoimidazolesuccinocarboxamide synthase [Gammaproteobacteria bacterium]|nr:phosphoribosylaminoimidazolesuccinocarboxamide synthase [Gammaproteobacteria bacterium]